MSDLTGHITKGYELKERIGVGGFGAVYRAFQSTVGREVAIKVILPQYANHPDFVRRFETEAQLVARLEHPFIVPLFDYWREPAGAYLVMRFLRGGSLREILRVKAFSADEAVHLLEQIAAALAVAHRNGVIHRDLKPDNILLDEDGNAYLTDFGIAKAVFESKDGEEEEEEEGISGSPGYMSPEQIVSEPVTPKTDIYSLGIMMFELMTGTHPFSSAGTTELIFKHLQEPLPSLDTARSDLPFSLNDVIQQATAKDPNDRFPDVITMARAFRHALSEDFEQATVILYDDLSDIVNPYKGLRSFEEADAADFFGRESLVQQLIGRLSEAHELARFLGVVGPSGSGKSSVVKAGLIPALRWGDIPGSEKWFVAEMVPGTTPLEKLEAALLSVSVNTPDNLLEQLRRDDRGLLDAVNNILPEDSELLIMIDQFEEVFTLADSESERNQFLNLISTAIKDPQSRVRIIVTLRADFYDRPLLYEGFGKLMRLRTEVVLPLSSEELERAITGPAERVGLIVDANLLAAIIADVREEPGALPLLQYVLTELFERREGRVLTLQAYQDSGGALGALARRADELYHELKTEYQPIVRQLFLRLVTLGEGTEDTRRRIHWSEMQSVGVNAESLQAVLDAFGKYRLLSFDRDSQTREPTIEVAHEALIREWKLLREWLSASRQDVRLQRSLAASATEWLNAKKDPSFLLRGTRLSQFQEWSTDTDLILTKDELEYLNISVTQHEKLMAEEAERQAREVELERVSRNRLRGLVTVLGVAFVIALGLSGFAFTQRQAAQSERDNAQTQAAIAATSAFEAKEQESIAQREAAVARSLALAASARQLSVANDNQLALALALEANKIDDQPAQVQRVLASIAYTPGMIRRFEGGENGHTDVITSAAISPNNQFLLSGSADGRLILWDAETGAIVRVFAGHTLPVASVAFSPDGSRILSGSWDRSLILWDTEGGEIIQTFNGHRGVVNTLDISADGKTAVSGSTDGIIMWDLETGEDLLRIPTTDVLSLAIHPDGKSVLSGAQSNSLVLWDLETGEVIQRFRGHTSDVLGVAISPDGNKAVSSSRDNSIIVWDLETGAEIRRLEDATQGHSLPVNSVAFSPDGNSILSVSDDSTAIVWDAATGQIKLRFTGHTGGINAAAYSTDGQEILTGADDRSLILWSVVDNAIIRKIQAHSGAANGIDFSPDGTLMASGGDDNKVIIWDVKSGDALHTMEGHTALVSAVDFSPDSNLLISSSDDQVLILWDVGSGEIIRTFEGHTDAINDVEFSPDGQTVVSAGSDNLIILWDVASGEIIRTFEGHTRRVLTVTFNQDGTQLLSGAAEPVMILWDVASGEIIRTFEGHTRRVLTVDFSPIDNTALSGSDDGNVILWNLETGNEIRRFSLTTEASVTVFNIAYSPDGTQAVTGLNNADLALWDVNTGQSIRELNVEGSRLGITHVTFSPDGETALTSMPDGNIILWQMPSLNGLINWIYDNRVIHEITCDERDQYSVEPLCETTSDS